MREMLGGYPANAISAECEAKSVAVLPLKERVKRQIEFQEIDKKKRERIIEILDKYPELEELMKVGAY